MLTISDIRMSAAAMLNRELRARGMTLFMDPTQATRKSWVEVDLTQHDFSLAADQFGQRFLAPVIAAVSNCVQAEGNTVSLSPLFVNLADHGDSRPGDCGPLAIIKMTVGVFYGTHIRGTKPEGYSFHP